MRNLKIFFKFTNLNSRIVIGQSFCLSNKYLFKPLIYNFCTLIDKQNIVRQSQQSKNKKTFKQLISEYDKMHQSQNIFYNSSFLNKLIKLANYQSLSISDRAQLQKKLILVLSLFVQNINKIAIVQDERKVRALFLVVSSLCLQSFSKFVSKSGNKTEILSLARDQKIAICLLKLFASQNMKNRSYIIKYIMKYQKDRIQLNRSLLNLISTCQPSKQRNIYDIIFYLRQLIRYANANEQSTENINKQYCLNWTYIKQQFQYISNNILMVNPKMLYLLSQSLIAFQKQQDHKSQLIKSNVLLVAVEEHLKGLQIIQSRNTLDCIYLLQTLQNIVEISNPQSNLSNKVTEITNRIYQYIKKIYKNKQNIKYGSQQQQVAQKEEQQIQHNVQNAKAEQSIKNGDEMNQKQGENWKQEMSKYKKLRLIDINIVQQSMLKLSVIDAALFSKLQQQFLQLASKSNLHDINAYLIGRIKIVKTVMQSIRSSDSPTNPQKLRHIKQQHTKFISNVIQQLKQNNSLGSVEIGKILQSCQSIQVKSRKIKRQIQQIMQNSVRDNKISKQQAAYLQAVMSAF